MSHIVVFAIGVSILAALAIINWACVVLARRRELGRQPKGYVKGVTVTKEGIVITARCVDKKLAQYIANSFKERTGK